MGGFVGMRLAIRRPELIKSLTLMETSSDPEPKENIPKYKKLGFVARWFGFRLVADKVMPIMFSRAFMNDPARAAQREEWKRKMIANNRVGISRALKGVITREGVYEQLDKITAPTLIIVGDQDTATVPAKSERMHARIKNSKLVVIKNAGHSSSIEEPEQVNRAIEEFLRENV
jgi:pimeloyl-ACP methyl ester carboxylesterase